MVILDLVMALFVPLFSCVCLSLPPAVQDLSGSDQRVCRALVRQPLLANERLRGRWGGCVSSWRCVPSLPLDLEARISGEAAPNHCTPAQKYLLGDLADGE
jgi:hypothetical protein